MANQKLPVVALVGATNAGKSSLFNRLIGRQEAIVAREPGTTRDSVSRVVTDQNVPQAHHDEKPYLLIDTAGLKDPTDEFETTIQDQIDDAVANADVILFVMDRTELPDQTTRRFATNLLRSQKPVFLLLNKSDLRGAQNVDEFYRLGIPTNQVIETSAEHATGLLELREKIRENIAKITLPKDDDVLRVALIGRPNVGKSFLFNTLANKQQAIVANLAGTTRDLNRVELKFSGQKIELIDTAGVRKPGKIERGIEKFSVLRTTSAIEEADICLLLTDVNDLATAMDQKLAGLISDAGKGLILVVSKWDAVEGKDAFTRDALAPKIRDQFDFVPWAPLIFTSATTGQNVAKIFELLLQVRDSRSTKIATHKLNDTLMKLVQRHPPAGLKNTHPKFRYVVQSDINPPWFIIYGAHFKFIHWSYKRYMESQFREAFGFVGTPIKFSFRDEKQLRDNRERGNIYDKNGRDITNHGNRRSRENR